METLTLTRRWVGPSGFVIEQHELRSDAWVLLSQRQSGARAFDFRPAATPGWSRLYSVSEGSLAVDGVLLEPGRWHLVPFGARCVSSHDAVVMMVATRGVPALDLIRDLSPTSPGAIEALLKGLGSASGLTLDASARQVAELVAHLTSRLVEAPTAVDLSTALNLDERRTSEAAARYFARFHATVGGWRDYVRALRLELALSAFSAGCSTREVARWLGFRNETALLHSMKKAGLPRPGALRAAERTAQALRSVCALLAASAP